jgi:hypothetical protein
VGNDIKIKDNIMTEGAEGMEKAMNNSIKNITISESTEIPTRIATKEEKELFKKLRRKREKIRINMK